MTAVIRRRTACLGLGVSMSVTVACRDDGPLSTGVTPDASETFAAVAAAPLFTQVSAGNFSTCGVTGTGKAYCWGIGFLTGDGSSADRSAPVAVAGDLVFRQISAGHQHSCGVTTDDRVYCWGSNFYGQLGLGSRGGNSAIPLPVAGGIRFRTVTTGHEHTCALTSDGHRAYCWGRNDTGQLGDGTTTHRASPRSVAGGRSWRQVSAGFASTCGVTATYQAFCWGSDDFGQLGDGADKVQRKAPSAVAGDHLFLQIDAGYQHVCAATTDQHAYCWGFGAFGTIGDGKRLNRFTPRAVVGTLVVRRVTAGAVNTCAETTTSRIYCWGYNHDGQLGIGFATDTTIARPQEVVGGLRFAQVSVGGGHVCGVTKSGETYCWGDNRFGNLGDGTTTDRFSPTQVVGSP